MEMRGADGGPWHRLCALPALWVGLLYDSAAMDAAWTLVKDWTHEEVVGAMSGAARHGLKAPFRGMTLRDVALEVLDIAKDGLARRARLDSGGNDETGFLTTLQGIAHGGRTLAEDMLEAYHGHWNERVDPMFTEHAY